MILIEYYLPSSNISCTKSGIAIPDWHAAAFADQIVEVLKADAREFKETDLTVGVVNDYVFLTIRKLVALGEIDHEKVRLKFYQNGDDVVDALFNHLGQTVNAEGDHVYPGVIDLGDDAHDNLLRALAARQRQIRAERHNQKPTPPITRVKPRNKTNHDE